MKNKFLSIGALLIAVAFSFAFRAEPLKRTGQLFLLVTSADPFDPLQYSTTTADPAVVCPFASKVCIIDVSSSDVYTSLTAPAPSYIGKPKVDIQTAATGELADQIQTALNTAGESALPVNGRIIYERN